MAFEIESLIHNNNKTHKNHNKYWVQSWRIEFSESWEKGIEKFSGFSLKVLQ